MSYTINYRDFFLERVGLRSRQAEQIYCGVQWTPVESEMGVMFLGSMRVKKVVQVIGHIAPIGPCKKLSTVT